MISDVVLAEEGLECVSSQQSALSWSEWRDWLFQMVFLCAAAQIKTQRLSSTDVPSWIFTHTHTHTTNKYSWRCDWLPQFCCWITVTISSSVLCSQWEHTLLTLHHEVSVHRSAHLGVQTSSFLFSSSLAQILSTEHRNADEFDFAVSNCVKSNSKCDVVNSILILYCYWLIICDNVFTPAITGILNLTSPLFHRWMHGIC